VLHDYALYKSTFTLLYFTSSNSLHVRPAEDRRLSVPEHTATVVDGGLSVKTLTFCREHSACSFTPELLC